MLRRPAAATTAALLLLGIPTAAAAADDDEAVLYTYVQDAAGDYGYSDTPVETYPGSGTQVSIPTESSAENRRFSSAWVATIANLNFGKPADAADFDARYTAVLDDFESWNMNAVIFQVRPLLDAYYPSELNPWSEFLTGTQGVDPGYDPMARAIEATHARGMEFHAWLNPYRVTNVKMTAPDILAALDMSADEVTALSIPDYIAALNAAGILADDNYAVAHPDQVLSFEEKLILDPGQPEVRDFVAASVAEIVENYDVDAFHFDDYFYPYRITVDGEDVYFGDEDEDRHTFEEFGLTAGYDDPEEASSSGVETTSPHSSQMCATPSARTMRMPAPQYSSGSARSASGSTTRTIRLAPTRRSTRRRATATRSSPTPAAGSRTSSWTTSLRRSTGASISRPRPTVSSPSGGVRPRPTAAPRSMSGTPSTSTSTTAGGKPHG